MVNSSQVKLARILPLVVQLLDKSSATPSSPTKGELMDIDSQPTPRKPFPLSAHEYLILKLCIGVYVPKMATHLQSNEDGAFQLLIKLIGAHSFDQFVLDALSPQELAINQVNDVHMSIQLGINIEFFRRGGGRVRLARPHALPGKF